jgi:hypothetical protein
MLSLLHPAGPVAGLIGFAVVSTAKNQPPKVGLNSIRAQLPAWPLLTGTST